VDEKVRSGREIETGEIEKESRESEREERKRARYSRTIREEKGE